MDQVDDQGVRVAMLDIGESRFELLEATRAGFSDWKIRQQARRRTPSHCGPGGRYRSGAGSTEGFRGPLDR